MIEYNAENILQTDCEVIMQLVNCQGNIDTEMFEKINSIYPNIFYDYKHLCNQYTKETKMLGKIQIIPVSNSLSIANIFCQDIFGGKIKYVSYSAFEIALSELKQYGYHSIAFCKKELDRNWDILEKIINTHYKNISDVFIIYENI